LAQEGVRTEGTGCDGVGGQGGTLVEGSGAGENKKSSLGGRPTTTTRRIKGSRLENRVWMGSLVLGKGAPRFGKDFGGC